MEYAATEQKSPRVLTCLFANSAISIFDGLLKVNQNLVTMSETFIRLFSGKATELLPRRLVFTMMLVAMTR